MFAFVADCCHAVSFMMPFITLVCHAPSTSSHQRAHAPLSRRCRAPCRRRQQSAPLEPAQRRWRLLKRILRQVAFSSPAAQRARLKNHERRRTEYRCRRASRSYPPRPYHKTALAPQSTAAARRRSTTSFSHNADAPEFTSARADDNTTLTKEVFTPAHQYVTRRFFATAFHGFQRASDTPDTLPPFISTLRY